IVYENIVERAEFTFVVFFFFFSSRRRHTRFDCDWSSDVCSSDLSSSLFQKSRKPGTRRNRFSRRRRFSECCRPAFGQSAFESIRSEERRVGKECKSRWSGEE